MRCTSLRWLTGICALVFLLGAVRWFHAKPIQAQQSTRYYDDGTFYIESYVDVDSSYYLYLDSYMEVEYDYDEDIDEIEVEGVADQDGDYIGDSYADGNDYRPAGFELYSYDPVPTGHEYGIESDGFACFDDGYGDGEFGDGECEWDYVGYAYAYVNVRKTPPLIRGLSPSSAHQGDQNTLTITGDYFTQNATDQLSLNFSGPTNPFTPISPPSVCMSGCTVTYSYDFTGYPPGTYSLSLSNNGGPSDPKTFTVLPATPPPPPADRCAVTSDPQVGFTSIVPTGVIGGSGTLAVSFSGAAYSAINQTVSYGPYSTPSSIAANIAALVTKNYTRYGLTARSFGPYIVYSGNNTIGTVNHTLTGQSIAIDSSASAGASAASTCGAAPTLPTGPCGTLNTRYVLAVLYDSVVWKSDGMNNGRRVNYSLEYWPTTNGLGQPTEFSSTITEHLTKPMSYGLTTSGPAGTGQFSDVLGNIGAAYTGTYITDRCFSVTSPNMGNLGQVLSYDAAGKHAADHIEIHLPNGPTILNKWTNPDGSPKNIAIP